MELTEKERFRLVMMPALLMGLVTNVYIASLMLVFSIYPPLLSPILSGAVFIILLALLRKERLSAKRSFLYAAYLVVLEVCIHTAIFGWGSGFVFYLFILPIVFILDSSWRWSTTIFFIFSVLIAGIALAWTTMNASPIYPISEMGISLIYASNLIVVAAVVIVVMLFFSRSLNRRDEDLRVANRELAEQNKEISDQHEKLQILVKEIHHRVKNNLQIISSLMSLQKSSVNDEDVIRVLNESKLRVEAIALIHQKLYQDEKVNYVDFKSYLQELIEMQKKLAPDVNCELNAVNATVHLDVAVPLGLVISELITNAMKHGFKNIEKPELKVILEEKEGYYHLRIKDNGVGLPADFDLVNSKSFGSEIIVALAKQIDAEIIYTNDHGACFDISFKT